MMQRIIRTIRCAVRGVALLTCGLVAVGVASAQTPTITPVTWNVIGLDSNDVTVGPDVFPVGARVCAGSSPLVAYRARFDWLSTPSPTYINLSSPALVTLPTIAANACQDVFFDVTITRNTAAYGTSRPYRIELLDAAAQSLNPAVVTPSSREIFVEYLISQNRNRVIGISVDGTPVPLTDPPTAVPLVVGRTYEIRLDGKTATQGYEQFEHFLTLPGNLFRVNSVASTWTANAGTDPASVTKVYADGCVWDNNVSSATYRECLAEGKYGGTTSLTYNVTVVAGAGSAAAPLQALLYDFSGSSYHYNADYGRRFVNFQIEASADLSVTKTDGRTAISVPGSLTYTVEVTNNGPGEVSGATFTDSAPAGVSFSSWTCAVINPGSGGSVATACGAASGSGNINSTVTMQNGAVIRYTITASVPGTVSGTITNTATVAVPAGVTDPVPGNNSATDNTSVTPGTADLQLQKAYTGNSSSPPADVRFTVTVTNLGPGAPSGDVTVTDTIPAGYVIENFGSWSAPGGVTKSETGGVVTWTIPQASLAAVNSTVELEVLLNLSGGSPTGPFVNSATVTSANDPNAANDTDADGPPDLSVTKTDGRATVAPGSSTTYSIVVSNVGASDVTGATVTDSAPAGVTFGNWTCAVTNAGTGAVSTACGAASGSGNLATTVTMNAGAVITYTVPATISPSASGSLTNTVTVSAPSGVTDPTPSNNVATDTNNVEPFADLAVVKLVNNSAPSVGARVTFTVTVTNNGPSSVAGASIVDTLPDGFSSSPAPSVTCSVLQAGTGISSACTSQSFSGSTMNAVASLGVGGQVRYLIEANVNGTGTSWLNTVTVSPPAGTTDPTPGNNTATAVAEPAILTIAKTVVQPRYDAGTTATFTIRAGKSGNNASLGTITVTDVPPPGMTLVTMSGAGWSCTIGATGVCSRSDDLLSGDGFYPDITVTATFAQSSLTGVETIFDNFTFVSASTDGNKYAETRRSVTVVVAAAPAAPIPTLSFWVTLGLGLLVSGLGLQRLRAVP